MKLTKYSHACFVLEKDGSSLVIDPGEWSDDFSIPSNVAGVVLTHEHKDHADPEKLAAIIDANPEAVVYGPEAAVANFSDYTVQAVQKDENVHVGNFALSFTGGQHAIIHPSYDIFQNVGVVVDESLYYPGDSFASPNRQITTLLAPAAGPWMKESEAIDFITSCKPALVIPTHDAILSEAGLGLADRLLGAAAKNVSARYQRLQPGETIDV